MMSENIPPFGRPEPIIVGDSSRKNKESAKKLIIERFGEKHLERFPESFRNIIETSEIPKKPFEAETIRLGNKITNNLLKELNLPQFDIPERNIHIIPETAYKTINNNEYGAATFEKVQIILINDNKNIHPIVRSSEIFHEMVHLKSYSAFELTKKNSLNGYRTGLVIYPTERKIMNGENLEYMNGLNEAIVAEIEKRYSPQIFKRNKYLAKEYNWQKSETIENLRKNVAKECSVDPSDVEAIDEKTELAYFYAYPAQRQVLHYVVDSIYKNNKNKFGSEDEVMKEFFRSHFTGHLLSIARLIENSFGEGSFRTIGKMTYGDEGESAEKIMNYLKTRGNKIQVKRKE
jgi:hypothetical protein